MTSSVTVTERAAERIAQIVSNEPENNLLRVIVEGGGCSGFEYHFDLVSNAEPEDNLIERAGAKVLVNSLSLTYLAGSEIEHVDDLMSASFKIKNPMRPPPAAAARASRFEAGEMGAHVAN